MTNTSLKLIVFLVLLLAGTISWAQPAKQYPSTTAQKVFYTNLVEEYCSKGVQEIFLSDKSNDWKNYVDGTSERELLASFETVIHELLHGYNNQNHELKIHTYFPGPGERVQVPMTKVFSSKELNNFVREGLQDSLFRYGLYVGGKQAVAEHGKERMILNKGNGSEVASISEGLYGLLEEFNAYYFGTLASWELYDYYDDNLESGNQDIWSDYKHSLLGNAMAYYEFRLFISWYLIYAEQNHPEIYKGLTSNLELRSTFALLDNRYGKLVAEIENEIPELDELSGPDVENMVQSTGSDKEIRAFLAENGIDIEAMGFEPGTPEWEDLRTEYLRAMGEVKASVAGNLDFFHAQPKGQILFLKKELTSKELNVLKGFRAE